MSGAPRRRPSPGSALVQRLRGPLPPKVYWKAGRRCRVDLDIEPVPAGNGVYGQESRHRRLPRRRRQRLQGKRADAPDAGLLQRHDLLRTIPITTGKAGFTTRSGIKVIMEKFEPASG